MLKLRKLIFIVGIPVIILIVALVLVFALGLCKLKIGDYGRIEIWYRVEDGKYYERLATQPTHTFTKFSKLKMGMEREEVYKLVGKPTSNGGPGFVWDAYIIDDDWLVYLTICPSGKLCDIQIIDHSNDRKFMLEDAGCCHALTSLVSENSKNEKLEDLKDKE